MMTRMLNHSPSDKAAIEPLSLGEMDAVGGGLIPVAGYAIGKAIGYTAVGGAMLAGAAAAGVALVEAGREIGRRIN